MSQVASIADYKKLQHRHDVGGALLFILILFLVGGFYVWGRKVNYDRGALEQALQDVEGLKTDLKRVTSEVDSQIINMGLESRLVADSNGLIVLCSPTAAEICGYTPQELLGKSAIILVPEEMRQAHSEAFTKAFQGTHRLGKVSIVRCMLVKKDGKKIAVEVIVRMVESSEGRRAVVTITPVDKIEFTPAIPTDVVQPTATFRHPSSFIQVLDNKDR